MFRSVFNKLIRNRIINGGDPKPLSLCSHFTSQNPYFIKVRFISSSISSIDQPNSSSSSSFVVSYLMNSCGLTEKQALSASKKLVNFETSSNPDSVLTLFESYGFTKPDISRIISARPLLLMGNPQKTLKPKLDYFNSKEISRLEVVKVLSTNPEILKISLENQIIPVFDFMKNIVGTDRYVLAIFQRTRFPLELIDKAMINIQALRNEGVTQSRIVKFLIRRPSTLMISSVKFKDIVHEVKAMGFDPYKNAFLVAIIAVTAMTKSTWESKLNAYRKWGWSEDEILNAFKIYPVCMMFSEKKISTTMDYLVNQMGVSSLLIAKCPMILSYSLEKRIMPRISVHRILTDKGLIKDKTSLYTILQLSRESFLEKFVIKFEQQAPELLKVKELS